MGAGCRGDFIRQPLDDPRARGQRPVLVGDEAAAEFDEVKHGDCGYRNSDCEFGCSQLSIVSEELSMRALSALTVPAPLWVDGNRHTNML